MELDETMCKDPVCQHPQCWGSFQRMERGIPHYRPLGYCQRSPSAEEGGLPVLSVSTMPTPPHSPTNQEAPRWHAVSPVRLAGLSYSALYKLYNKTSSSVAQKVPPNATSHKEPIRPRGVPGHSAIHGPDVAENRATSLVWMPTTPCPKQKKEETLKPLRVGITALTLGTLPCKDAGGDTGDSEVPKVRKKTQVPTGGCPQSLSVSCIQPPGRGPLQGRASGSPAKERALELKGRVSGQHFGSVTLPAPIIPELGNQRVVLHSVKEKHQQGAARLSPVYKLDNQHLEALNDMEIKLQSIRNQYYLWNKYTGPASPSGRRKPPDQQPPKEQTPCSYKQMPLGVIGNLRLYPYDGDFYKQNLTASLEGSTPYACGSDSRRLISLGSISHGSWAESHQSSAGMDSLTDSQSASQREAANEDVTSKSDVSDVTLAPEALQPTHTLKDTATLPTDPSEPASEDIQAPLEQGVRTPQPNAPPPTPLKTGS